MPTELAESTGRQFVFHRCGLVLCAFILGCGSGFTVVFEDSTRFSGRELHLDGTAYAWWRTFDAQALDRKLDPGIWSCASMEQPSLRIGNGAERPVGSA